MIKLKYVGDKFGFDEWEQDLTVGKIYEAKEDLYNKKGELVYCEIIDDIKEEVVLCYFRLDEFELVG